MWCTYKGGCILVKLRNERQNEFRRCVKCRKNRVNSVKRFIFEQMLRRTVSNMRDGFHESFCEKINLVIETQERC